MKLIVIKKFAVAMAGMLVATFSSAADKFEAISRSAMPVKNVASQVYLDGQFLGSKLVVVGERGLIASSNDGEHWMQAESVPTSVTLTAVKFVDDQNGWAVGHGGVVIATNNGGKTWIKKVDGFELSKTAKSQAELLLAKDSSNRKNQELLRNATLLDSDGPDKPLLDLHFVDAQRGWVIGAYGLAFQTNDAGKTWLSILDKLENEKGLHLYSIARVSDVIYIVGEQGQIFKSSDLGKTFKKLKSPYAGTWFAVFAKSEKELVVGGLKGNLFTSKDGGDSWKKIVGLPPVSIVKINQEPTGALTVANQGGQLFSMVSMQSVKEITLPQLPPLTNIVVARDGQRIALTLGGIINLNGEMK
jgi:photosystem II stability/assembly factor-like uncharacterized protein